MKTGDATEGEHNQFRPTTNPFDCDQIVTTIVISYCMIFNDIEKGRGNIEIVLAHIVL